MKFIDTVVTTGLECPNLAGGCIGEANCSESIGG